MVAIICDFVICLNRKYKTIPNVFGDFMTCTETYKRFGKRLQKCILRVILIKLEGTEVSCFGGRALDAGNRRVS